MDTEHIAKRLGLPADLLYEIPIVHSLGKHQLFVHNYQHLIEYDENKIKLQTKSGRMCIEGVHLCIDYFSPDEMQISGVLQSIHYF